MKLTAIIEAEGDGYVSLCPELDIASQGDSVDRPGTIFAKPWNCFSRARLRLRSSNDCVAKST